jgi:RNA polymerase sigma-70 factor (ECF subfamily)
MGEANEADLILKARAGDRAAYGQLVRMHQRRVYGCALHLMVNAEDAEDAVQEVFVRAWRALARFDGRSALSTWLYRICVNVCLNAMRRKKRAAAVDIDDPRVPEQPADPTQGESDPDRVTAMRQLSKDLCHALDALSPSLRSTVILVLIQGLSHQEAALVLGCPEGTVAWRIHEARRRLRDALSPSRPTDAQGSPREAPAREAR